MLAQNIVNDHMSASKTMRERKRGLLYLVAEIIWNLGPKPVPMATYAAPLLYLVLGLSAIVLLFFCPVTSCVHSEVHSAEKCIFLFPFSVHNTVLQIVHGGLYISWHK